MEHAFQPILQPGPEPAKAQAIRFPLRAGDGRPVNGHLPRLSNLLPRRWRRQVVIHGHRFWLPG